MTTPKPPNGQPADARIIDAIINLCNQFGICGLEPPVAVVVKEGQTNRIGAMVRQSNQMLLADRYRFRNAGELRIWDVTIREEEEEEEEEEEV